MSNTLKLIYAALGLCDKTELKEVCFMIGDAVYQQIDSTTQKSMILDMIGYMNRRNQLDSLVDAICDVRPDLAHILKGAVPLVVVAMTSAEATSLETLAVFANPPVVEGCSNVLDKGARDIFTFYLAKFHTLGLQFSYSAYQDERWDWLIQENESVSQIVLDIARRHNVIVQDVSMEVLNYSNASERRTAASNLKRTGGILIVDVVSLFHPAIRKLLIDGGLLSGGHNITTLLLPPLGDVENALHSLMDDQFDGAMFEALRRFKELDMLCEIGGFGHYSLRRWLNYAVPLTAHKVSASRASQNNSAKLQDKLGLVPGSINDVIRGGYIK